MADDTERLLAAINQLRMDVMARLARMRDDLAVVAAIVQRLDGTIAGLVAEIRATHTQQSRFDRRLRKLEGEDQP